MKRVLISGVCAVIVIYFLRGYSFFILIPCLIALFFILNWLDGLIKALKFRYSMTKEEWEQCMKALNDEKDYEKYANKRRKEEKINK